MVKGGAFELGVSVLALPFVESISEVFRDGSWGGEKI
jgi:hypothetical protein